MSTKTIQGRLWSVAPQYWSRYFEPSFLPLYRAALQQLRLNDDHLVLDAGCGAGLFSNMVIKTGAQLIGVDAAPGLLDMARRRNPQNSFIEEDLESLPFTDDSFHVVAGFNSFQYAGNFEFALREARRVLKPGGKLVIGIWDKPEFSDATNVLKAISTLLPPPPPGTPGPFALSEDGRIEGVIRSMGMRLVSRKSISCPILCHSLGEGVKCFMGTGPAAAALTQHTKQVVEDTIAGALMPLKVIDDIYFLQNQFLLFIAEK